MKVVKEIVRKYYKYVPWTQPILSANGTIGGDSFACSQSSVYSNAYAYRAFDNNSSSLWHSADNASLPHWLEWYNPEPLKISEITLIVGNSSTNPDMPNVFEIQNSPDGANWTTVYSATNSATTAPVTLTIDLSTVENNYAKYWRYVVKSVKGRNYGNCRTANITATYAVEATQQDYDFYKDTYKYSLPKETIRKYYKYEDEPWTRPNLTANGTMGGAFFAVSASTEYNSDYLAYKAFDNSNTTDWATAGTHIPSWITFYNPRPLKVSLLTLRNRYNANNTGEVFLAGNIYGSNDNLNWNLLTPFTNSVTGKDNIWTIDLSNNTSFYKYYKIEGTSFNGTNQGFANIAITAVYQNPIEESPSFQPEFIERKYYKYDTENPVPNVDIIGTPSNDDGILSGFSSSSYVTLPNNFIHASNSWEVQFKVTTGSNVSTQGCICEQQYNGNYYGLTIYIQSGTLRVRCGNGSSIFWNVDTSYSVSANTTYWIKARFTGSQYILTASTDGENWTTASTISSSTVATDNYSMNIGRRNYSTASPWLGSIDLKGSYIKVNEKIWWEGVTYPIIEGTSEDYDYYEDIYNYDFYKDVDVYKAVKF